uniref:Lfe109p3 n=1 Tax=Leptospirillum ferrooxidans TaxID=180 RepID=Q7X1M6_9BACT|nr:Lfe109p3 [Leptospirillum ferrooxidans]
MQVGSNILVFLQKEVDARNDVPVQVVLNRNGTELHSEKGLCDGNILGDHLPGWIVR